MGREIRIMGLEPHMRNERESHYQFMCGASCAEGLPGALCIPKNSLMSYLPCFTRDPSEPLIE